MKKIIGLTRTKNESDIIESLCRYAVEFCDALLLYENDSIDNTREIVQKLIDEGLPIHFMDDIKEDVKKGKIKGSTHAMTHRAFVEFGADIVLKFDADEFLCTVDGRNPREVLESLDETVEYRILWRSYAYQGETSDNVTFLPSSFEYYRNPKLDHMPKAIMSRYLYEIKGAMPGVACHFLVYPFEPDNKPTKDVNSDSHGVYSRFDKGRRDVDVVYSDVLRYAHYPIRSKAQLMSKIIPNWIWQLRAPDREEASTPWKNIYDYFRQYGGISDDVIKKYSLEYAVFPITEAESKIKELGDDAVVRSPLSIDFCNGDLSLKYSDYKDMEKTWIKTALTVFEDALTLLPEREAEAVYLMRETRRHNFEMRSMLDVKEQHINELSNSLSIKDQQINELTHSHVIKDQQINELTHSHVIKDQQINELVNQQGAKDLEIQQHKAEILSLQETITRIYASRSWKLGHFFGKAYQILWPFKG